MVIAGTQSGSGKTILTLGLMAAIKRRGLKLKPFKVGPDFIDPGHHSQIVGGKSRNLDGWMLSKKYNLDNFAKNTLNVDIALIEGVMGLFDGYDGKSEAGSTAQIAKWLGAPVLLIVDASGMARSAAAVVKGFENFDPDICFAGVVFNRIGSCRHLTYLKEALSDHVTMPVLGGMRRSGSLAIPERHLGLVTREDYHLSKVFAVKLADLIEQDLDLDRLLNSLPQNTFSLQPCAVSTPKTTKTCIGVARDTAFCFYYHENLELLEQHGIRIKPFSPIKDANLPKDIDGLYFGGGYPELYARDLTVNAALRKEIRVKSLEGMPIYGECGGLMYLGEAICDLNGKNYPMTGCLPFTTRMLPCLKRLGYREITLTDDTLLGSKGTVIRGHEFHYSEITDDLKSTATVYRVTDRSGLDQNTEGYQMNRTLGSYIHLHWGSCPAAAKAFVNTCRQYRKERSRNA